MSGIHRKNRLAALAGLLLLCLPMQSCFTTALWSSDIGPRGKAGLTPVAVALDVVTLPAQIAVLDGRVGRRGRCR